MTTNKDMTLETFTRRAYDVAVKQGAYTAADGDFAQWCEDFSEELWYCHHFGNETPETFWKGFC